MPRPVAMLMLALSVAVPAAAQDTAHVHDPSHSAYVSHEGAEGTVLTPKEISQLRNGEGMGLALPAELNRYPGPLHTLELEADLKLTPNQVERTREIFDAMKETAVRIGEQIIMVERHLNQTFQSGAATREEIRRMTGHGAELRGELDMLKAEMGAFKAQFE